jgi:ATPase subunit of ABC transporter with duplicated ATPase domains
MAMEALRCPPKDADVTKLSGGERRRVALCKLLLIAARPAAARRTDQPSRRRDRAWLEKHLRAYPGAVMMMTHDRYFLDNVTGWILELDRGRGIPYEGNYSSYLVQKAKRCCRKAAKTQPARRRWNASRNGSPRPARRRVRPSRRRVSSPMTSCSRMPAEKHPSRRAQIIIPVAERLGNVVIDLEGSPRAMVIAC